MTILAILRMIGATILAIAVTFALLIAVEFYSSIVHPTPPGFDSSSMEQMCQHVANYPHWILATVVPMWGGIALLGTWVAGRLGNRGCAIFVAILILVALIGNIAMLPYPLWFKIVQPMTIVIGVVVGFIAVPRSFALLTKPSA